MSVETMNITTNDLTASAVFQPVNDDHIDLPSPDQLAEAFSSSTKSKNPRSSKGEKNKGKEKVEINAPTDEALTEVASIPEAADLKEAQSEDKADNKPADNKGKKPVMDLFDPITKEDNAYVRGQKQACQAALADLKIPTDEAWYMSTAIDGEQFVDRDGKSRKEYTATVEQLFKANHPDELDVYSNELKAGGRTWKRDWFYSKKWFQMRLVMWYRDLTGKQKVYLNYDEQGRRFPKDKGHSGWYLRIVI